MRTLRLLSAIVLVALSAGALQAQIDARMLRQPDVSSTHIAFVYAGDIWVVPKSGGTAQRLSSPNGQESVPRLSPDGSTIAFTGNYDGNADIYTIPTMGGEPVRVTHHPMGDRVVDWYPDGRSILYASSMESGRQRFNQFYRVARDGGLPEKLPLAFAEYGAISPDGEWLAFIQIERDSRTWKRYRGGRAPDIWLFNLDDYTSRNITTSDANDAHPMWHGRTLYFLSDRGPNQRQNIWAYDLDSEAFRQITRFEDFDIHLPAIGPSDIVFEAGGRLYLLDLASEEYREVAIDVVTDLATLKPRVERVSDLIFSGWVSPSGKRAVFEARGDVFTVPAEHGPIRNLTASSGVAERYPTWSPDGRYIAYWSDRSGEYELTLRPADGSGGEERLTSLGAGYRYRPQWSPDSKKLAFVDHAKTIYIYDVDRGRTSEVDQDTWMTHGGLNSFSVSWSSDSRWMAYSRGLANRSGAIFLYDTQAGRLHQVTSSYYSNFQPTFDPDGKYLYYLSNRTFQPSYSDVDNTWVYPNTTNIVAVSLRSDVPSPLAPRSDDEEPETEAEDEEDEESVEEEAEGVEIELENFEHRVVILPPEAGNYTQLQAVSDKLLYRRLPRTGSGDDESPIVFWDLEEREEKTVMSDADGFLVTADGKKMLVWNNNSFAIVNVAPNQKMDTRLRTGEMEATIDPRAEWRQLFADAWRLERDFFYDPGMHGVDWNAMKEHYGRLLEDAVTRWDVNFVIGELIAELNASHTYRGGGDTESAERRSVGLLGVDWSLENGAYRIETIVKGAPWDAEVRSPLAQPGVDVNEGDYVLAVNGVPLDTSKDPWASFQGLAGRTVELTVNGRPTMDGARTVLVETLRSETRLRHLAWIDANRERVEEASDGRVGYVYVRSTGGDGQRELVRQFAAQFHKDGLIIDERFNSGGQIPDRFVELLQRPPLAFWAVRTGTDWQWPPISHFGPKVMLINGWSGSGGDAFPYYFREYGVGPLVGTRTWGGLIGMSGVPQLIDGGVATVPTFRMYSTDGVWFAEGYGVDPDIEVLEDPTPLARGVDAQLERAIQETLRLLEQNPPVRAQRPRYENRTANQR
ncbi:MAG: peptidase S41 [Gemmatimonadetes bacterium]|nr:peptidase S41 [Gemmatimonadota bacterium]NIO30172.1 peptidase S41 [Gemmatimonadota bacterium]